MSSKRKSLDDALGQQFVYGNHTSIPTAETPSAEPEPSSPTNQNIMSKLLVPAKEPTIRFTVDLSESMHKKLSLLAAHTGRKKADIVRLLLDEALKNI